MWHLLKILWQVCFTLSFFSFLSLLMVWASTLSPSSSLLPPTVVPSHGLWSNTPVFLNSSYLCIKIYLFMCFFYLCTCVNTPSLLCIFVFVPRVEQSNIVLNKVVKNLFLMCLGRFLFHCISLIFIIATLQLFCKFHYS